MTTSYIRPREKLLQKGASALHSHELLQIIIGSGVQGARVQKIARRLLKQLHRHGHDMTIDMVLAIPGIGTAKACTIAACLELAKRFPRGFATPLLDSDEGAVSYVRSLAGTTNGDIICITIGADKRLVADHKIAYSEGYALRSIVKHALADVASTVIVAVLRPETIATLDDLQLAKDLHHSLLAVDSIHCKYLVLSSSSDEYSVVGDDARR